MLCLVLGWWISELFPNGWPHAWIEPNGYTGYVTCEHCGKVDFMFVA